MDTIESIGRELRDLRGDFIGVKRAIVRGRRDDRNEPDLAGPFIAQAAASIMHHLKRHDLAEAWLKKAVTNPAMTTVTGWASELAQSVTANFILSLSSGSKSAPSVFARAHGFELSGATRAVSIDAMAVAAFVAEGSAIGVSQATLSSASVLPHAVKCLVTYSEELADNSTPTVETVLRQILTEAVGTAVEDAFFSDDAATNANPAGVLLGATIVAPGTDFAADVKGLVAAIAPATDPLFVTSPARRAAIAAAGGLVGFDYAVLASSAVGDDTLIAIDADKLAVGFGGAPGFKTSSEATLVEDTAPPNDLLTGTPVRSLWQTNSGSLKATLPVSWATKGATVAIVTGITW
ncbi:phage major capsid protein [Sinorhizobium medicae]|uniref:phage major capsid protein n=1 Tax=Sinorhizobium medicae TaxID=110321 RepID=UPI00037397C9|nr:phage major capsid protein [Sinorhizobium medicae]MDX0831235.1 phage major capsid protein [Sinorhizobium medicae]RVI57151.1 phage major capsid protein [Sinorhizobium medicae]UFX00309.1 phage major capsid protein [Sinorhizobium medicae WSM1115]